MQSKLHGKDEKTAGQRMYDDTLAVYKLNPAEHAILRELAAEIDLCATVQRLLDAQEPMVEGAAGQPRANPLFSTLLTHRELVFKLTRELGLPDAVKAAGGSKRGRFPSVGA